jgi:heme oxygenase
MEEIESEFDIQRNGDLLCQVVADYTEYVLHMRDKDEFLAHIYVRHFGDMYGGQMIKKRNPGSGKMYEFNDVEQLKTTVRKMLHDDMADEANICFQFAMQLFEELESE